MTKAFDLIVENIRRLPEEEQNKLAQELEPLVAAARQRAAQAMIERIRRESPFRGLSEQMKEFIRADRENWAFGPERKEP